MPTLHHLTTGYCVAHERMALRDGAWRDIRFHATCALIAYPRYGPILFDTGYAPRFFAATARYPYRLYAQATPVTTRPEWSLAAQLPRLGYDPAAVRYVILSHFHADHVAGLRDFPQAEVICSRAALTDALGRRGLAAVRRAILPDLLPPDLAARATFVEDLPREPRADALGHHHRWLPDGSLHLIDLPGHARGQIGALLRLDDGHQHLLAADAFWLTRSLTEGVLPSRLTRFFIDSWADYLQSWRRLRAFHQVHPEVAITSCHCPSTVQQAEFPIP